jgi:hypothetical protein
MSQNLCAKTYKLRPAVLRMSLLGVLVLAGVAIGNTACEDKAIGRACDVLTPTQNNQAVYNSEALECPSRICLKPALDPSKTALDPPTGPYCSASCSQDSDCDTQQNRDSTNKSDHRCQGGFLCGVPFVKGRLCCQKLCLCKDFLGQNGAQTPIACQNGGDQTCYSSN